MGLYNEMKMMKMSHQPLDCAELHLKCVCGMDVMDRNQSLVEIMCNFCYGSSIVIDGL